MALIGVVPIALVACCAAVVNSQARPGSGSRHRSQPRASRSS